MSSKKGQDILAFFSIYKKEVIKWQVKTSKE